MTLRWLDTDNLPVIGAEDTLTDVLGWRGSWEAAAVSFEGQWWLLDSDDLDELLLAGHDLPDVLATRPETPLVSLAATPEEPALVEEQGRIIGAWVDAPDSARRRSAPAAMEPPPMAAPPMASESMETGNGSGGGAGSGGGGSSGDAVDGDFDEAAAAATTATDGDVSVERTPHLDAPERIPKTGGHAFHVDVYADTAELGEHETGEGIVLDLPPGVDTADVGVLLQVTRHFEVDGREFGEITISRDDPASTRQGFELRVSDTPPEDEEAVISALFTFRGHPCGRVARSWEWTSAGAEATPVEANAVAPVSMPVHVDVEQPDLSIYVTKLVNDGVNYVCAVETPLLEGYTRAKGSVPFAVPANGYAFMNKLLDALIDERKTAKQRLRSLVEVGHEAWEAAPLNVKEVLWALVDAGKPPESVYVCSVEPILPWELMIPRRFDGKQPDKLEPLGVTSAIGRWTRADSQSPPSRLPVASSFVIAPVYQSKPLDSAAEVDLVEKRLHGRRVEPASVDSLDALFAKERASLLHFVCHGDTGVENDDVIQLDNGEQLRAREMEAVEGFEALCGEAHPLVFLNSCSTGQMVPSLGGGSGFPRSFGNLGAHGVIAPLWPVADELASTIALELYKRALDADAPPLAAILRDIRKRGYDDEDVDTYAAYCFYGDPLARLELVDA